MNYLNCKNIETAIRRAKKMLEKRPVYEDFGYEEIEAIKEKFIDSSSYTKEMAHRCYLLMEFDKWCMNYH